MIGASVKEPKAPHQFRLPQNWGLTSTVNCNPSAAGPCCMDPPRGCTRIILEDCARSGVGKESISNTPGSAIGGRGAKGRALPFFQGIIMSNDAESNKLQPAVQGLSGGTSVRPSPPEGTISAARALRKGKVPFAIPQQYCSNAAMQWWQHC